MDRTALLLAACAAAASALPAHAGISPQAQAVVARWIGATGGRDAFLADTALHVQGKLGAGGMHGRFEWWSQGPTRLLAVETVGTVRVRDGYDGAAGWRTDLTSHKVAPLQDKDLEAIAADAWFASEQWARDDQGGGRVWHGQTAYTEGRSMIALDVTPPVGPERTLWSTPGPACSRA